MLERDLREVLLETVKHLEEKGYNHGSSGNVSCRLGEDFLITPTGARSANLTAESMVHLRPDGSQIGEGVPSSEWHMHLAIMRARPDVNAVIHTHADCCVALSCLGKPIPAFHYMIAGFGGNDIPCAAYATFGTPELAENAIAALSDRNGCLLANHGMIVLEQKHGSCPRSCHQDGDPCTPVHSGLPGWHADNHPGYGNAAGENAVCRIWQDPAPAAGSELT